MPQPIITLTTDYGTSDHLVGTMKGVILKISPDAHIVDISHSVLPFDILDGALTVGNAYRHFPPRTISSWWWTPAWARSGARCW